MKFRHFPLFIGAFGLFFLSSCKKDKKVESETSAVTTTTDGNLYIADLANSKIEWKGYKVFKSDNTSHIGTIALQSGQVTVKDGKLESGKFVANMGSLTSVDLKDDAENLAKLNGHLKSADFFDVEKFPTATYEITKISEAPSGSDYNTVLNGNLTIKGITKPVEFNANVKIEGKNVLIATQPKDIKREDFGVVFQVPAANGIIKDEITLQILVNAKEKK
ncbi:YceI family protein [Halpernia sp.]|uniref:YceI family protein n=1 Tax=Halpernia sp. TaxID=2782209 RepID=UPI003A94A12E